MISYEPLWNTLEEKNISTYTLISKYGVSKQTIYKLRHNESTTLYTIQKLCDILGCESNDIVIVLPDKK